MKQDDIWDFYISVAYRFLQVEQANMEETVSTPPFEVPAPPCAVTNNYVKDAESIVSEQPGKRILLGQKGLPPDLFEDPEIQEERPCLHCRHFLSIRARRLRFHYIFGTVLLFPYAFGFWLGGAWIWGAVGGLGMVFLHAFLALIWKDNFYYFHNEKCASRAPLKDPHIYHALTVSERRLLDPMVRYNKNWQCRFFESKDIRRRRVRRGRLRGGRNDPARDSQSPSDPPPTPVLRRKGEPRG